MNELCRPRTHIQSPHNGPFGCAGNEIPSFANVERFKKKNLKLNRSTHRPATRTPEYDFCLKYTAVSTKVVQKA